MTDQFAADIDAMIAALDGPPAETMTRFIVATDWSHGAAALTMLKAFTALVPTDTPIELVLAVPREPVQADVACVGVLAEGAGLTELPQNVMLASFDEVQREPYDCAIVPDGNGESLVAQVGGAVTRLVDVLRIRGGDGVDTATNEGNREMLTSRLSRFECNTL